MKNQVFFFTTVSCLTLMCSYTNTFTQTSTINSNNQAQIVRGFGRIRFLRWIGDQTPLRLTRLMATVMDKLTLQLP